MPEGAGGFFVSIASAGAAVGRERQMLRHDQTPSPEQMIFLLFEGVRSLSKAAVSRRQMPATCSKEKKLHVDALESWADMKISHSERISTQSSVIFSHLPRVATRSELNARRGRRIDAQSSR